MGRIFRFTHERRELEVRVRPIEEAWELWLFEKGQQVEHAATVTIDAAVVAGQSGSDLIAQSAQAIEKRIIGGETAVNSLTTAAQKPEPSNAAEGPLALFPI